MNSAVRDSSVKAVDRMPKKKPNAAMGWRKRRFLASPYASSMRFCAFFPKLESILFVLMSLEVMMNATALAFVVAGSRWVQPDGQVMFILVITLAAAEASIGLAILLQLYRRFHTLDVDAASEMRG